MTKYEIIFESLQEKVDFGELTLEDASILNDIAYERYSSDDTEYELNEDFLKIEEVCESFEITEKAVYKSVIKQSMQKSGEYVHSGVSNIKKFIKDGEFEKAYTAIKEVREHLIDMENKIQHLPTDEIDDIVSYASKVASFVIGDIAISLTMLTKKFLDKSKEMDMDKKDKEEIYKKLAKNSIEKSLGYGLVVGGSAAAIYKNSGLEPNLHKKNAIRNINKALIKLEKLERKVRKAEFETNEKLKKHDEKNKKEEKTYIKAVKKMKIKSAK